MCVQGAWHDCVQQLLVPRGVALPAFTIMLAPGIDTWDCVRYSNNTFSMEENAFMLEYGQD